MNTPETSLPGGTPVRSNRIVRCPGCGNEIDEEVCHCGDLMKAHDAYCGHNPVPMGCDCGRCKLPDNLTLDAEIVRTKIQLIELEKDRPKKTTCHCGKPLNKDGLCWCCDPISTCWPQDT